MLIQVEITDFALIDQALLQPQPGLMIMTGETGAGKSILIDAISFLCGSRTSKEMIRHGQDKAVVEAVFCHISQALPESLREQLGLDDHELQEDQLEEDQLILTRELFTSGRTVCRINGRLVPLSLLREIASYLIDIHGQHDQQSIFQAETHLQLLDRFGGEQISTVRTPYQQSLQDYRQCQKKLAELGEDPAERARLIDMLRYQTQEIEAANIKPAEDDKLTQRRKILANAEKISSALAQAYDLLSGEQPYAVLTSLGLISQRVESAARHSDDLSEIGAQITEAQIMLQGAADELRRWLDTFDLDPAELERVDERLDQLYRLKQKYGGNLEAVNRFFQEARSRLEMLEAGESTYEKFLQDRIQLEKKLREQAEALTAVRRTAAQRLEQRIAAELGDLGMPDVRFAVMFEKSTQPARSFTAAGQDQVAFNLSANPGEPPKPLALIASGGEASRIMLAIKVILAQADQIPVLIFDEIDSGVSGHTADRVAEKLLRISRERQVFCITHLAQIAAMADTHVLVAKAASGQRTSSHLTVLTAQARTDELGRLLSGGIGQQEARKLAGHLLKQAGTQKELLSSLESA